MKKGFLAGSIALIISSSLSNTAFSLPVISAGTDMAISIIETLSDIPAGIASEKQKEEAIKKYDERRFNAFFASNYKKPVDTPITVEDHFNKIIYNDMQDVYRELEPKMSDINQAINESKQKTADNINSKVKDLENKIDSGDQNTLRLSREYTNEYADELMEYTETTNKQVLEESQGYTDNIAMDLVETIHQQHDSAVDTSKKYTDQISNKNNKAHHAKFQQLESMHMQNQAQNETRFSQMDKKISKTAKQANSGIASVAAMSNIPYAMNTRFSLGAGLGNYRNGNAVAVGAQYQIKENVNLRSSVSWNNSDSAVVGAGIAIGW